MADTENMSRRALIKILALAGLGGAAGAATAGPGIGAMMPGKGWMPAGAACEGDGTPLQFIPKVAPDENPLENELTKYPSCPYCGMNRTMWAHSRHLVQYDDNLVDGTCSIHCLAISLALNIDRSPKVIYAADFGAEGEVKPMVEVDKATYLIGSSLKGTMSTKSKMAFASADAAKAAQAANGGDLGSFDDALKEAYLGMANDTIMVRKNRAERRMKMMEKMKQQG